MTPTIRHLLYLHGFRSSPQSTKARQTQAWLRRHHPEVELCMPQLPASPKAAMALAHEILSRWPHEEMAIMGSSLGGFYASLLAETWGCRVVLLNPAVNPARDLAPHLGLLKAWHSDDTLEFDLTCLQELQDLGLPQPTQPSRYCVVIAKGDEVLDWHEMLACYGAGQVALLEGGNHALTDFPHHLPALMRFLGLPDISQVN